MWTRLKSQGGCLLLLEKGKIAVGKWETGFWFSTFPSAAVRACVECGNREAISKGRGKRGVLSTARHFHRRGLTRRPRRLLLF